METNKSSDLLEQQIIASMLRGVQTSHSNVLTPRACRLTIQKINKRVALEGISFLTKTLPRLGKALDKALSGKQLFNKTSHRFKTNGKSELPIFMGELFEQVFSIDGVVLPTPCVRCIKSLRQILYLFYKLELPYTPEVEQKVLNQFTKTEQDVLSWNRYWETFNDTNRPVMDPVLRGFHESVITHARIHLHRLFESFDVLDIKPRHGPGVVSTKEKLWGKYQWSNVSERITNTYPVDEFFFVNLDHVCDRLDSLRGLTSHSLPAQVILVPKDSRGPRLISCEPVDFQWIQQGLSRAIVQHVENHPLTRGVINFTDQEANRNVALLSSRDGAYSTLDLNEASDRVSLGLVRLLFPEPLQSALLNCRTSATKLPNGQVLNLGKYAPMGSALCFPVLALTIWALVTSAAGHAYPHPTRAGINSNDAHHVMERILVYGDDVIVPSAFAEYAITTLEAFGLKVNRDKSCTDGFFRESCGMDAYKGVCVTPVRFRTVWSHLPCPSVYTSYIAYANELYDRGYYQCYDLIVERLNRIYGWIPDKGLRLAAPSIIDGTTQTAPVRRRRRNKSLQKLEYLVYDTKPRKVKKNIDGWSMLLRFFAEGCTDTSTSSLRRPQVPQNSPVPFSSEVRSFEASSYTKRRENKISLCWR